MNRRRFLLTALAAPVIVKAASLMPVRVPLWTPPTPLVDVLAVGPMQILLPGDYTVSRIQAIGEQFTEAKIYAVTIHNPPPGNPLYVASARDGGICYIEPYVHRLPALDAA